MDFSELEKLIDRVNRFKNRINIKDGKGAEWSHTFEDGETHFYSMEGVRPPEEIEDDISSMFIWLWSLKDYVRKYVILNGKNKTWVKNKIINNPNICVCADIANSLKHGGLDKEYKPWSGKNPKLKPLKYIFPQEAIGELKFGAYDVNMKIKNPQLVQLEMAIVDEDGITLGDAFKYLDNGLIEWEGIINGANKAV